ncbi:MAG: hypothetical protein QOH29_79 [Actinomycetota bacterium]|jgi:signal transduction histidine kinase|nr:hypothetical protein [Actinomycetota bacterium]
MRTGGKPEAGRRGGAPRRTTPLRRRVLVAIVSATALGVVLFAIPLAFAVQRLYHGEHIAQLQRDANRVAASVPEKAAAVPRAIKRPSGMSGSVHIGVYRIDGRLISGTGPAYSALAAAAVDGRLHEGTEAGRLTVTAPVPSDTTLEVIAQVSLSNNDATNGVLAVWATIAAIAAAAIILAAVFARRQARAIALPLEQLTAATTALGAGELPARLPPSGILEADAAAEALQQTAGRLVATLRRQRAFQRDVSHQLRTPLTGLMLGLESALARPDADLRGSIETAVGRLEQLQRIVEELLLLAEPDVAAETLDFDRLSDAVRLRWHGVYAEAGRQLAVHIATDLPDVHAPEVAVRQILDVLIGNALQHGAGTVAVTVNRLGDGVAIDVSDEGPGFAMASGAASRSTHAARGLGLPLARSLTQLAGGSLVEADIGPAPVLRLLLPSSRLEPGRVDAVQEPAS